MSTRQQSCAFQAPQPGEIWQVSQTVQSPLSFSEEEQQRLYSEPAFSFLQGNSSPRYVTIIAEAERMLELQEWQTVSVMVLSSETQFLSDVDILIPATISGLERDVLAETWHLQEMLVCNLSHPVGRRLSRQIYDLLLTIGDCYHGQITSSPTPSEIQTFKLQAGHRLAKQDLEIQAFHQREEAWSDVLTVPLAAYRTYLKGLQFTDRILQNAIASEQELASSSTRINLGQWFQGAFEAGWQVFSEVWAEGTPTLAIATRSDDSSENSFSSSHDIAMLIARLRNEPDERQRRWIAKQLGDAAIGSTEAIQALVNLLRSTQDDETLWTAVESLWQLDPGNPAAGLRQVKLVDLGMQVAGQAVALAVALVQKVDRRVGVLLQVYPTGSEPYLPANLKLVLLDGRGQILREVVARQSDVYIQLKFSGQPGEEFGVRVTLGDASINENFVI